MSHYIVPEKKLARLIAAVDALAIAEEDYLEGRIPHKKYQTAIDRVIAERDKLGLSSLRITHR